MLNYPKIKERFPAAYNELLDLSNKTGITDVYRLVYEYLKLKDIRTDFFLLNDLKYIEKNG